MVHYAVHEHEFLFKGDAAIEYRNGRYYASAFLHPIRHEKPSRIAGKLMVLSFMAVYVEAPTREKLEELRVKLEEMAKHAEEGYANARKEENEKLLKGYLDEMIFCKKHLAKVAETENMLKEHTAILGYVCTTCAGKDRHEAVAIAMRQMREIRKHVPAIALKEEEIKRCFEWEHAVERNIEEIRFPKSVVHELEKKLRGYVMQIL
ncbi:MAG: hypothetical protein ABIH99_05070 [Candidatus Micrarchaeota archaeon]